uniref:TRAF-like family protein n=1 Tax=Steinernema glaseri TaxID=37863 RepID=A0A1I7Z5Y0_9BILA
MMDEVPFKFVDSVVELLGKQTLDSSVDLNIIRKNRRFIRIQWIKDDNDGSDWMLMIHWEDVQPSGEPEIAKLLGSLAPQIEPSSSFDSIHNSPGCQHVLLRSLINKAHFCSINLYYYGKISHDFLEDQINNSPFLERVLLRGEWPQSVLTLMATFCLKSEPRRPVSVELRKGTKLRIDINYLRTFFDAWKAKGRLQCKLTVQGKPLHVEERRALKAMGRQPSPSKAPVLATPAGPLVEKPAAPASAASKPEKEAEKQKEEDKKARLLRTEPEDKKPAEKTPEEP